MAGGSKAEPIAHEKTGQRVVILVDEYDKPRIQTIGKPDLPGYFKHEINELAAANGMTFDECLSAMRQRYDGYHFHRSAPGMYNPYSVLLRLAKQELGSYWFPDIPCAVAPDGVSGYSSWQEVEHVYGGSMREALLDE